MIFFHQTPNSHLDGESGCPKCNISKGELKIQQTLLDRNIGFISQYIFDNCKYKNTLPFDFYLPEYNICIEYDGEQPFLSKDYWGGDVELLEVQKKR